MRRDSCSLSRGARIVNSLTNVLSGGRAVFNICCTGFCSLMDPGLRRRVACSSLSPQGSVVAFCSGRGIGKISFEKATCFATADDKDSIPCELDGLASVCRLRGLTSGHPTDGVLNVGLLHVPRVCCVTTRYLLSASCSTTLKCFGRILARHNLRPLRA